MAHGLTDRQREVWRYWRYYRDEHGFSPRIIEAAKDMGISPSAVWCHLNALIRKGWMRKGDTDSARTLVPVNRGIALLRVADFAAGSDSLA